MVLALVTGGLVHFVLPVTLLAGVIVRQNAFSFVHLILLLVAPTLPLVTTDGLKRSAVNHSRVCCSLGIAFALAGTLFQLLCWVEVIPDFEKCSVAESILRHLGLVSYKTIPARDTLRLIVPDIVLALISALCIIATTQLNLNRSNSEGSPLLLGDPAATGFRQNPRALEVFTNLACVVILGSLLFAGAIRPSVTSSVYYACFLGLGTMWACRATLGRPLLGFFCRAMAFYSGLHVVVLFWYQVQWFQAAVPPDELTARLFGLVQLVNASCIEPGVLDFVSTDWDYYASPMAVLMLYAFVAALGPHFVSLPSLLESSRRKMSDKTPLLKTGARDSARRLNYRTIEPNGGADGDEGLRLRRPVDSPEAEETDGDVGSPNNRISVGPLDRTPFAEFVLQPLILFVNFTIRSSYIGTLIVMMTWSITYHSWLSFVLLLWACILWMVPDQKSATERNTPFLVFYCELLVIGQYIFGMEFTEDEIPSVINGWKFGQIGFIKYEHFPVGILVAEGLYLVMFWITMRQWLQEKWEKRKLKANVSQRGLRDEEEGSFECREGENSVVEPNSQRRSEWTFIMGQWFKRLMAKIWIWVVAIMLFVIGIGSGEVVIYRIVYTAFFLLFVSTFQISYGLWRRMMYGFWLVVILFSMVVLVSIYTYQFDDFDKYWLNYAGMNITLQRDLGLEQYGVGELFLRLLTPTFFVIITIIQLHYFHGDFIRSTDYRAMRAANKEAKEAETDLSGTDTAENRSVSTVAEHRRREVDALGISDVKEYFAARLPTILATSRRVYRRASGIIWRLLEIHVTRLLLLSSVLLAVYDVCAAHAFLVLMAVIGSKLGPQGQKTITHSMVLVVSALLLLRMIYQIDYIKPEGWTTHCAAIRDDVQQVRALLNNELLAAADNDSLITDIIPLENVTTTTPLPAPLPSSPTTIDISTTTVAPSILPVFKNLTGNNAEWLGFKKESNLPYYVRGYIGLLVLLTIHGMCRTRQRSREQRRPLEQYPVGVVFPETSRQNSDEGLVSCAKYLVNYVFYRFGVEITLITIVAAIGSHLDVVSTLHALWLLVLFMVKRERLRPVWTVFTLYLTVLVVVEYAVVVGLPWILCTEYPWTAKLSPLLVSWLYLPSYVLPPDPIPIVADFLLLLMAVAQRKVFKTERDDPNYPGGSNGELSEAEKEKLKDPVLDFTTYTRNYLDMVKKVLFFFFFWTTLAIVFLAGKDQISLFALGYVVGTFIFLWMGNGLFLKPLPKIRKYWNCFIFYNILVILLRASLQSVACVYMSTLFDDFCWVVQVLGISCMRVVTIAPDPTDPDECRVPNDEASFLWDGLCLAFLLLQKRMYGSFYFQHVVNELRVQHKLASLGAQLLRELTQKKMKIQEDEEAETLEKIRDKTTRIREAWEKHKGKPQAPHGHYEAIRSGDYYMFEDAAEESLTTLEKLDAADKEQEPGMTVTQLMSSVMKSSMEQAMQEAKLKRSEDSASDFTLSRQTSVVSRSMRSGPPSPVRQGAPMIPEENEQERQEAESGGGGDFVECQDVVDAGVEREGETESPAEEHESLIRKLVRFVRFGLQLIESSMISATAYLNKVSADYRYMTRVLQKEKRTLKEAGDFSCSLDPDYSQSPGTPHAIPGVSEILEEEERFERDKAPAVRLLFACWYAAISRSEVLCYFFMCLNQLKSASILSLPLPFMAFFWGTLSIPRPTRRFWVTVIGYTELVILIKYVFQFNFWPWTLPPVIPVPKSISTWVGILGIEQRDDYAIYDLILLMSLFFHRFMLKSVGLWKKDSVPSHRVPSQDPSRVTSPVPSVSPGGPSTSDGQSTPEDRVISPDGRLKRGLSKGKRLGESMQKFFKTIDEPPYQVKADVYAPMFLCDFTNFLVLVFGFNAFGGTSGDGGVSTYLEENKVPIPFLILLIVQFGCIVIDRALYLKKSIYGKLVFQYVQVLMVHMWMFFILPYVTDNKFGHNLAPQIYYFVKCIYFLLSAYQIRCGYPTRILGNVLCKKYNYLNMILFKCFMIVPFLYELRAVMDWMWTYTSLSIFDWLKMEDIFAQIFQLKCQRRAEAEYPLERGTSRPGWYKYGIGGAVLALIIAIVWFPLVLFALANTVGIPNRPNDVTVEISVGAYQPLFQMAAQHSALIPFTQKDYEDLRLKYAVTTDEISRQAQFFLTTYDYRDVVVAQLNGNSTGIWTVSPPSQDRLIADLIGEGEMSVKFAWSIQKTSPGSSAAGIISGEESLPLVKPLREELADALNSTNPQPLKFLNLMPKFLRVSSKGDATPILQLSKGVGFRNLTLQLNRGSWPLLNTVAQWWEVKEDCEDLAFVDYPSSPDCNYLRMYIFNDKVFPSELNWLSAGGIIGMYISVVLVVGKVCRVFFVGLSNTIMFEDMPNVDRVLQLSLDIYLVRESGALDLEEDLFAKLIFLYRSPETLIKWTYPSNNPQS